MVGVRDLDDYGTWEATPTYGAVWYPSTVAVGWAPYRYGSWTWVAPFGWTWVDSAPWGYAPFHYGRWIYAGGRWGWCPGERTGRPRWAPALVAWYGGSGWAGGSNAYGWVPLGWGEAYTPSWGRCSGRCLRQYNQPYAVAQTDRRGTSSGRYINASVPGAMTAVPAGVMSGSRPVAPNQINIGSAGAASAPMLGGAPALGLAPARNAGRPAVAGPIPAGAQFQQMEMSRNARAATPQSTVVAPAVPQATPGAMPARRAAGERAGSTGFSGAGSPAPAAAGVGFLRRDAWRCRAARRSPGRRDAGEWRHGGRRAACAHGAHAGPCACSRAGCAGLRRRCGRPRCLYRRGAHARTQGTCRTGIHRACGPVTTLDLADARPAAGSRRRACATAGGRRAARSADCAARRAQRHRPGRRCSCACACAGDRAGSRPDAGALATPLPRPRPSPRRSRR